MDGMESVALFALIVKLIVATMALVIIMFTLQWFNRANNRGLKDKTAGFNAALRRIRADAQAAAIYYGLRFVGIAAMYGMILS